MFAVDAARAGTLFHCLGNAVMGYPQIAALAVAFVLGAAASGLHYRTQLAELRDDYAQAAEKYQGELRQKERQYAKQLAAASDAKQAEIDRLNGTLSSVRSDVERLRIAAARRRSVPGNNTGACESCERQIGECVRLLAEGAGLVETGGGLLRNLNADRSAVKRLAE